MTGKDSNQKGANQQKVTAESMYADQAPNMRPLLELGTGAIIAFLAGTAQTAQDPGPNPNQTCPTGTFFDFLGAR
jgi:hypothetical protein